MYSPEQLARLRHRCRTDRYFFVREILHQGIADEVLPILFPEIFGELTQTPEDRTPYFSQESMEETGSVGSVEWLEAWDQLDRDAIEALTALAGGSKVSMSEDDLADARAVLAAKRWKSGY
jgi:hypothetical protein